MPKLTIDGKEIEADASMNLINAAELAGIEIPHYCYHEALSIPGNCRMCLVEVEKAPKLQIACNTRVAEGMVVHTTSDKAKTAQKAVLEFLLINHPIDCPVCDQAGECKLQDYYMDYDQQPSRFPLRRKKSQGQGHRHRLGRDARSGAMHPVRAMHAVLRRNNENLRSSQFSSAATTTASRSILASRSTTTTPAT